MEYRSRSEALTERVLPPYDGCPSRPATGGTAGQAETQLQRAQSHPGLSSEPLRMLGIRGLTRAV